MATKTKNVLLTIGITTLIIIGVLAAALLMWKVVFPFIGWVLGGIFSGMAFTGETIVEFFQSLFN